MRYQIANDARRICGLFGCDPARVARRADMPADFLTGAGRSVSAAEFYDLWDAVDAEVGCPDLPMKMAQAVLDEGFDSAIYSFFSSPTVRIGLTRKALFKPLLAPLAMTLVQKPEGLEVSFGSILPGRSLPHLLGWFDLAYFVLAIRRATGEHIVPARLQAAAPRKNWDEAGTVLGADIAIGRSYGFTLHPEDADKPLVSRNDALWAELERGLQQRFAIQEAPSGLKARVRQALVDGLPGGQSSAEQIAAALAMSKRSLQRHLSQEGVSFKHMLEETRRALALNYLQNTDMSVQEIAYLLGFRDPTSFFRAFRGWTGRTPQAVRRAMG